MSNDVPVPNAQTPDLTDGQVSYAGGVNAADRNFREVRADELSALVNGTVRDGWAETRPPYRWLELLVEDPRLNTLVERGKYQGMHYYGFSGGGFFVLALDGELVGVEPLTRTLFTLNPGPRPFSREADFVYFEERDDKLICREGPSTPVIVEGFGSRYSRVRDNEVGTGGPMADGWNRLASVDQGGRGLRFSDHEMDPTTTPLSFNNEKAQYLFSAARFEFPRKLGRIVGLAFPPFLDSDTGAGPLTVWGTRGTRTYDVSIPRAEWASSDIGRTALPTIGACSHRCFVARATDIVFSDHKGRIRSLQNARADEAHPHVVALDRNLYPLYRNEDPFLRRWRTGVEFDDRVLVTVLGETVPAGGTGNRKNVRHRALAVLENDVSLGRERLNAPVWAGLWTGICPLGLATGLFSGSSEESEEEICLILSADNDGINRFYVLEKEQTGADIAPSAETKTPQRKEIEMIVVPRVFSWDAPTVLKRPTHLAFRLGGILGNVEVRLGYMMDGGQLEVPWDVHRDCAGCEMEWPSMRVPLEQVRPRVIAKALPQQATSVQGEMLNRGYLFQPVIRIRGRARLEDMALIARQDHAPTTGNTRPEAQKCLADFSQPLNLHTFDSVKAVPLAGPEQTAGCAKIPEPCA